MGTRLSGCVRVHYKTSGPLCLRRKLVSGKASGKIVVLGKRIYYLLGIHLKIGYNIPVLVHFDEIVKLGEKEDGDNFS